MPLAIDARDGVVKSCQSVKLYQEKKKIAFEPTPEHKARLNAFQTRAANLNAALLAFNNTTPEKAVSSLLAELDNLGKTANTAADEAEIETCHAAAKVIEERLQGLVEEAKSRKETEELGRVRSEVRRRRIGAVLRLVFKFSVIAGIGLGLLWKFPDQISKIAPSMSIANQARLVVLMEKIDVQAPSPYTQLENFHELLSISDKTSEVNDALQILNQWVPDTQVLKMLAFAIRDANTDSRAFHALLELKQPELVMQCAQGNSDCSFLICSLIDQNWYDSKTPIDLAETIEKKMGARIINTARCGSSKLSAYQFAKNTRNNIKGSKTPRNQAMAAWLLSRSQAQQINITSSTKKGH
jgi:hypothetical protein